MLVCSVSWTGFLNLSVCAVDYPHILSYPAFLLMRSWNCASASFSSCWLSSSWCTVFVQTPLLPSRKPQVPPLFPVTVPTIHSPSQPTSVTCTLLPISSNPVVLLGLYPDVSSWLHSVMLWASLMFFYLSPMHRTLHVSFPPHQIYSFLRNRRVRRLVSNFSPSLTQISYKIGFCGFALLFLSPLTNCFCGGLTQVSFFFLPFHFLPPTGRVPH